MTNAFGEVEFVGYGGNVGKVSVKRQRTKVLLNLFLLSYTVTVVDGQSIPISQ